jgi:hypothetical protein
MTLQTKNAPKALRVSIFALARGTGSRKEPRVNLELAEVLPSASTSPFS